MSNPKDTKKSKWGMFGHKDRPAPTTDSTYGSNDGSYNSSATQDRDSYASGGSLTGSDNYRENQGRSDCNRDSQAHGDNNREPQGQHTYVNDQGQVVTTTTTTTTTTTSSGGGPPHSSNFANKLDPRMSSHEQTEVTETRRDQDQQDNQRPNIPAKNPIRERSPQPPYQRPQQPQQQQQPQIQARPAPSLQSGSISTGPDYGDPASPNSRHNFSYPSRTPPPAQIGSPNAQNQYGAQQANYGAPMSHQQQQHTQHPPQSTSTLQNLKTAAVGIHGVGETLRGTLNSNIDRRFHGSPETLAHNQAVLDAGRTEIQSGHLSDTSRQAGGIGNPVKGILRKRDGQVVGGVQGQGQGQGRGDAQGLRVVNE